MVVLRTRSELFEFQVIFKGFDNKEIYLSLDVLGKKIDPVVIFLGELDHLQFSTDAYLI
jgi:hypothetical protein